MSDLDPWRGYLLDQAVDAIERASKALRRATESPNTKATPCRVQLTAANAEMDCVTELLRLAQKEVGK